jgi:tyrosinase
MLELIPTTFAVQDKDDMIRAAQTWRLPFWDWAMKKPDWHQPANLKRYGPNVPYLLTVLKVQVKTKTGVADIDNPMWKFTLQPNEPNKVFGDYGITDDGRGHPVSTQTYHDCLQ